MPTLLVLAPLLFALNASDSVPPHDTLTVASRALGEPRRVNVHVPAGYAGSTGRFPVLYMPDGGIDEDFPHVVNTVDSLIALGEIRPVIVVGVPNTERRRDLTGPTRVHSDSAIAPHVGGSAAFRGFFRDELIPEIDKRYRTTSERAIIGESLAGLFIVETFLREPGMFDHYVAFDPSLWWNHGALVDSASMLWRSSALDARQSPPTIYFAGSKDGIDDRIERLAALLRDGPPGKVSWSYLPRPDLTHATIFAGLAPAGLISALQGRGGEVVNVWSGVAPGSEKWKQKEITVENTPVGTVIMNVVTPTLTAYLPDPAKATGTGVIIAPGGAFVALAITLEAIDAAKWLQQRGIAAFVLKYRTVEKKGNGIPPGLDLDTAGRYGMADGIKALEVVRRHASQWHVDPHRIGFLGFSAGAMVASATLVQRDAAARPNFAALLYGGPFNRMPAIPASLPPVFMAWAQDDPIALKPATRFRDALIAAGNKPEVHIYSAGGHGFGMHKQGTSSDHWIEELYYWMEAQGFTKPAR